MILNATGAIYFFCAILFTAALMALFYGIVVLYRAINNKDEDGIRKAKFILLLAVITLICVSVVSFFITGSIPLN
ncbi:MAG: hypothetical protein EKK39_09715 [Sphingobacteriales bacterium]|uniref:hypothetical protein n=1 Tax=Hydrotalea flava TaxID=714549 RepID=UPI000830A5DB|nr:hypothetical protein [Hydrotalea flava]RTL50551.1 MAG: hypothetical protein EKK39_09715 [Sphingobacteriales bacterium]